MIRPEDAFEDEAPGDDVAEQLIPVDAGDDEAALEAAVPVSISRDSEASEADLIDQSIAVPLAEDEFDR